MNRTLNRLLGILLFIQNSLFIYADNAPLVKNPDYLKSYSYYLQAELLYSKHQYETAIFNYKKAIKTFPGYPEPYYKLIKIFIMKDDLEQINNLNEKCIKYINLFKNKNELYDYYKITAEYYEKVNDNRQAIDNYMVLIHIDSNNRVFHYKIGSLYYTLKQQDEAYQYLNNFVNAIKKKSRIKPNNLEYRESLQMLININMDRNNFIEAYDLLTELNAYWPDKEIKQKMIILSNNLKYYK